MSQTTKKKILIVDDEDDLREALAISLQRSGYCVVEASCGKEALALIQNEKPDLVLSDVRMPNGDGIFLVKKLILEQLAYPPVIFITGYADLTVEEAYDLGVEAIFPKPFDLGNLNEAIKLILKSSESNRPGRPLRMSTDLPVLIEFDGVAASIEGQVTDLGKGGLFVKTKKPLPQNNQKCSLSFQLDLQSALKVQCHGVVRWVSNENKNKDKTGFGVEFVYQNGDVRRNVYELINFLKTKYLLSSY